MKYLDQIIVQGDTPVAGRDAALALLAAWDGHFVDGDWATGTTRADAWILMDAWIKEVIELTFEELDVFPAAKSNLVLFNVLLHALKPGGIDNYYNWFQNAAPAEPQTADEIIVAALDNTLATLGDRPWGTGLRGIIPYNHAMLGNVWDMPFSSRSTYAHVVEYGSTGPVNIKSMFPLGESGTILGVPPSPVFDANFFTMTPVYDNFVYRDFPLFTP